ncbi:hypothetical protein ASPWEDRAFT_177419 [Aspergillus wentii DTO 134E9]|uniref:Zn(2)-C6 fungal-type domain-containing protein n=1 Tax=Aspergillus wentii DTO 134E9 TaxID=1073089 RepID=A0A1L9R448_ASPWE|nr:uncharacterized protein ASPWEDRAFT_177419 [Aspergillus wentii DTO 134E9]OJJ29680.1 hypothetical protein ASPWEDRAFT_177419 [Aspergillus wentii DTO 134E9]
MPPHLNHRKSTRGCLRCKTRKVKCDENKPQCSGCHRHNVPCEYPSFEARRFDPRAKKARRDAPSSDFGSIQTTDLRLMHHYATETAATLSSAHFPAVRAMWAIDVPEMAFEYEPLLHTLLALAAVHRATLRPDETDQLRPVQQAHIDKALQHHRSITANLAETISESVCVNTILISLYTLTLRAEAPMEPYEPPLLWMNMSHGIRTMLRMVYDQLIESKSRIFPLLVAQPIVHGTGKDSSSPDNPFQFLLHCHRDEEDMDESLLDVYKDAIAYLETNLNAIKRKESDFDIRKRFSAFPAVFTHCFIQLVSEKRPRALVILAYLFALVKGAEDSWWLRGIPEREVRGINSIMPLHWKWAMAWPLHLTIDNPEAIPMPVADPGRL